ncbi:glycosyltransferase family 61 protein [Nocardioides sp.]|uniref:glycosyltransferase family 61 protein n=1 Tax=Nocardioides sp. TaxID=35761 RepID=UPI002B270F76|nr:glycosyltransferase family 61 protein [Nocardioides sp.]
MRARPLPTLGQLLTLLDSGPETPAAAAEGLVVVIARTRRQLERLRFEESGLPEGSVQGLVGRKSRPLTEKMIALPPIALVIDVRSASGPQQGRLFEAAYFALDVGARWAALLDPDAPEPGAEQAPTRPPLMERVARTFAATKNPNDVRPRWRTHLRSSDQVVATDRLAVFRKGRSHLLKIRDADAIDLLPRREPQLEVQEIAAHEVSTLSTHDHHQHGTHRGDPQVPEVMESPRLSLRRYDGTVTLPVNALAYHGRTLLPDSFRWHLAEVPTAWGIRDTGTRFARLQPHAPARHLTGSYYHFGYNNSGHFGHLMTEALAKLWGWDAAKADDPSLKILCRLHPDRQQDPARRLETQLLPAYGIDPDDIVWVNDPVSVDRLYACTPMWHNTVPFYAHEGLRADWARLRDGVLSNSPSSSDAGSPEKVFVTRHGGNRRCSNVEEVEALASAQGYTIVQPERLPLAEQVATFAGARVVAGFGGAGMFNLAYAQHLEAVVVLNQWAYEARNEQLFAAVQGAACHTFWSEPDLDHPADGRAYEAHQSDWSFDLGLGDELSAVLASL